jgi:hypothetical protein
MDMCKRGACSWPEPRNVLVAQEEGLGQNKIPVSWNQESEDWEPFQVDVDTVWANKEDRSKLKTAHQYE